MIWLTESGRYEDSIRMVTALGRLFRISLSRGKRVIPLESELDHAGYYMTIQRIRYKNKFTFEIIRGDRHPPAFTCLKLINSAPSGKCHTLRYGGNDGYLRNQHTDQKGRHAADCGGVK